MTLIVSAGALLFLHQLPVSVVVACAAQLQILLLHRVCWYLLDSQPVQRLLSGRVGEHGKKCQACVLNIYQKIFKCEQ